jgi:hypothetical protein
LRVASFVDRQDESRVKRPAAIRSVAARLIRLAERLLPREKAEWAEAMRSELHHIDGNYEALGWAFGCLLSSIKLRINAMELGSLRVSRWVLTLEMALCFGPLTLGWFDIVFGQSGVARLNAVIIEKFFLGTPGGTTALAFMVTAAILGVLGPVGAVLALRAILLNRPLRSRSIGITVIAGSILVGVVLLAQSLVLDSRAGVAEIAGMLVLFSVLPAAGTAHLTHLGRANTNRELPAY